MDGAVSIVTGGSRGIGRGICLELAKEGSHIGINYTSNQQEAEKVRKQVESYGVQAVSLQADVSKKEEVDQMMDQVYEQFGKIDHLINNAGICPFRDFFDIDLETWNYTIDVNLKGMFLCSQAAGKYMKTQGKGSIVNITSVTANRGGAEQVHYAASKGGGNSLTTSMAYALGKYGIRVNAVVCGGVVTDINRHLINEKQRKKTEEKLPAGRWGKPQDLGKAVVYLVSDDSSWVTGSNITVDGGFLIT